MLSSGVRTEGVAEASARVAELFSEVDRRAKRVDYRGALVAMREAEAIVEELRAALVAAWREPSPVFAARQPSWQHVGDALGVTRARAWQRYASTSPQREDVATMFDRQQGRGSAAEPTPQHQELSDAERMAILNGPQPTVRRQGPKVGRNDPCPCGSGAKSKKCCDL